MGMSDLSLFLVGIAVTIPAALGIVGLLLAAVADGRENDRIHAEIAGDGDLAT
jgi:hypothetical protein